MMAWLWNLILVAGVAALPALLPALLPDEVTAAAPGPPPADRILIEAGDNELTAWVTAPVAYSTIEMLLTGLERPLPSRVYAARLSRATPPETIHYVLCVTSEGTLVLGQQVFALDLSRGRPVFAGGEITRSYAPLEGFTPWTWLVHLEVSREASAVLELQATALAWPVRQVRVNRSQPR